MIDFRKELQEEPERSTGGDPPFLKHGFIESHRKLCHTPLLVQADYSITLKETQILCLFRMLAAYGKLSCFRRRKQLGLLMMQKKHMKQVGHSNVQMFFADVYRRRSWPSKPVIDFKSLQKNPSTAISPEPG